MAGTEALKNVNKMIGILEANEDIQKEQYKNAENISEIEYIGDIDMKNIILRSDGRYMIRKQVDGKRVTLYAKTLKEAIKISEHQITKKALSYEKKKPKTEYTLKEWFSFWVENYKKPFVSYKSYQIINQVFVDVLKTFGTTKLDNLTTTELQRFYNSQKTSRKKENMILYLKACLQKAVDLGYINKNPASLIVKDKKLNVIREPFNYNEQIKILEKIKNTDIEAPILFYLATGIRKNELNTKDIMADIDIEHNLLKVKSEKKRASKDVYRYVDISPKLVEIVQNNLESFKFTTNQIYRKFKQILEELNIKGSIHSLRHTFTTNQFYLGTPVKIISEWLGHEKVELTQNIYTHVDRTITKEMILKLYNNLYYEF